MSKGIFYVTEAAISLLLLSSIIIVLSAPMEQKPVEKIDELYITQRLHDVIKCRFIENNFSIWELEKDFRLLFPGKSGELKVGEAKMLIGERGSNAIAVNAIHVSDSSKTEILVLLFTD